MTTWLDNTSPYFSALNLPDAAAQEKLSRHCAAAVGYVEKYCRREFLQADHTDIGFSTWEGDLVLLNCPVASISRVCCGFVSPMTICHPTAQVASFNVHDGVLVLSCVVNGVATSDTLTLADTPTLTELVAALPVGWTGAVQSGWGAYPSADLSMQFGNAATVNPVPVQQWADYTGQFTHDTTGRLNGLPRRMPVRVSYVGGFSSIPDDLLQTTASIAASSYNGGKEVISESLQGWSYTYLRPSELTMSDRKVLNSYRERLT